MPYCCICFVHFSFDVSILICFFCLFGADKFDAHRSVHRNIFLQYNQQNSPLSQIIYSCKTLYMYRTVVPSIIRCSKLHIRQQAYVKQLLLESSWNVMAHGDAREGKWRGKLANGVGSQYSSHYLGILCIQHYYRWYAHLGCQYSTELTPLPI